MIMRQRLLFFLLFCPLWVFAAKDSTAVFQGYSGGMMVHAGYLFGDNPAAVLPTGESIASQGITSGIGGSLRVNLKQHLRIGCEGFVSTMNSQLTNQRNYLQSGSYVRTGWGGVLTDACWRGERFWPFIGGSVGGGAMHTLAVVKGNENDWIPEKSVVLNKQSFMYINPYIGIDYCLTHRVHVCLRLDWMLAFAQKHLLYPTGPRLYIGFMFCH